MYHHNRSISSPVSNRKPNIPNGTEGTIDNHSRNKHSITLSNTSSDSSNCSHESSMRGQNFSPNKLSKVTHKDSITKSSVVTNIKHQNSKIIIQAESHSVDNDIKGSHNNPYPFSRAISTQSFALGLKNVSSEEQKNTPQMTLYERTLYLLANDPAQQKEVALGKRIGFYRLGKELGAGNFSKVKLGVHVLTKEKVAIKLMEKSKMDQKAQRLLEREIESMEILHHPNIIRLFECVETLSKTYLIMEYAGGGELYNYVHTKGKLPEEIAKPIFAQLISAVAHMHSKKVIHRDIKAENVIFSQPGWVKLADFGFSCKIKENVMLKTFCGSPPYAAPELFKDQEYYGPGVDIWALGVLLYFMLVGVTPFRGDTVSDLKQTILKGQYNMPDYLTTFAQHVINRMLDINPQRRMTIEDIKKTYWLNDAKFVDSYVQCSLQPDEKELESSPVARTLWNQLHEYGITKAMMNDAAGKGARNAIIGTYRIVLFQAQFIEMDKQRVKVRDHMLHLAERKKRDEKRQQQQSRACSIM
ncbi:Protein kinase domain and Serine/threonine-/dual specificity protein kinase, catalytic domain and Protein kinase-like domain-containing protein [Strongyloides ratti]|uniref:non-specific serine/threonine protein kinase n=1 Tax=Strongyloides ratti TaxID=34506 RepID=A0A090KPV8_STRRB|nr:Protein kinase domain and Serine/threonine-/dual specificity protein kinase, catalytic domain and Protein kinase-like domain-containing protein [Strongyloides ratti]CEF59588.1 Protein kinase domain and Serine/threonine-/dual specificity protein kinase, catalytic domain and Protein kinase-like domain-containing protein [Strongyloides ratti]